MTLKIYKYMTYRYALQFLSEGSIRLGTLYSFRNEEEHGSQVGDEGEGTINLRNSGTTLIDTASPATIPAFFRQGLMRNFRLAPGARLQILARDGVRANLSEPDCWVFCASRHPNRSAMIDMGYDTCIEIGDVEAFFFAISHKIPRRIERFWGAAECVYRERAQEHTDYDGIPPAFIKPPRFMYQAEVRAVWLPVSSEPLQPIVVRSRQAARHCRILRW